MENRRVRHSALVLQLGQRWVLLASVCAAVLIAVARPSAAGEGKRVSPGSIRVVPDNATVWGAQGSQHFMVLA